MPKDLGAKDNNHNKGLRSKEAPWDELQVFVRVHETHL